MLKNLHVENYVLIDSLDISFPEGLVIITGQTGAGKSILLGALSLLTGVKADASLISEGADTLVVEAEFDVENSADGLRGFLRENDLDSDDEALLIRRVVSRNGRSRCFINDEPVGAGVLGELASYIIDIHSQHQNLLLCKPAFQLSLLDHYAGCEDLKEKCAGLWAALCKARANLKDICEKIKEGTADEEYKKAQWEQLDKARLVAGEYESLEAEQRELASAEEIKELLAQALQAGQCTASVKDAEKSLEKLAKFLPAADELSKRMESARIELEDIFYELDKKNSSLSFSEDRLSNVEDRISTLLSLMRRHDVKSVEELISLRDSLAAGLCSKEDLLAKREDLEKEVQKAEAEYDALSEELHDKREEKAPGLSDEIQKSIRSLELDKAVFEVSLSKGTPGASGTDTCTFLFDANGHRPGELSKSASGGEMSRIMLCIKEMTARYTHMPTMIFDEIDTGVSGSVAHKIGRMICRMGENMQVFAITHLPQVAAKGDAHYIVRKIEKDGRSTSGITLLDQDERVQEIARLLSGESITAEALANAKSLLAQ